MFTSACVSNPNSVFPLTFLNYNVCGLLSKLDNGQFVNFISKYDFVSLTETFVTNEFESNLFKDHCVFSSKARKISHQGRNSGGVVVVVKKCYSAHVERVDVTTENTVVLKISKELLGTAKDVMFISMYIQYLLMILVFGN